MRTTFQLATDVTYVAEYEVVPADRDGGIADARVEVLSVRRADGTMPHGDLLIAFHECLSEEALDALVQEACERDAEERATERAARRECRSEAGL